jgi:predicted NBD/HSP70 family sugar kinase
MRELTIGIDIGGTNTKYGIPWEYIDHTVRRI